MDAATIPAILESQHLPPVPKLITLIEQHEATEAGIHAQRFEHTKREEELATARTNTLLVADAQLALTLESDAEITRLTQEKTRIKATARGETATLLKERVDRFSYRSEADRFAELHRQNEKAHTRQQMAAELPARLAQVRDLEAPSDLQELYEDACLTTHEPTIRAVGRAVLQRLQQHAAAAPPHQGFSALDAARSDVQQRHAAWVSAHPSAAEQVRAVDAALEGRTRKLRDAHRWVLKYMGLRQ